MFLAVDIGNSNITFGVFDKGVFLKKLQTETKAELPVEMYVEIITDLFADMKISSCAIASVVEGMDEKIKEACNTCFDINALVVTRELFTDLRIDIENKNTIGIDRLINVIVAAENHVLPAVVIDAGTAITIDVVSRDKEFLGGIIMPGLKLQAKSLNDYTSKLPLVDLKFGKNLIGKNTEEAILSGIVRGTAFSIGALVQEIENEVGKLSNVIITGGDCVLISKYLQEKISHTNPLLTLEGLKIIYDKYKEC